MGSGNSSRRQSMAERSSGRESNEGVDEGRSQVPEGGAGRGTDPDLATILSYLVRRLRKCLCCPRCGQVRILGSGGLYDDDDEEYYNDYEDEEEGVRPSSPPPVDPDPDTSNIKKSELWQEIQLQSGGSRLVSQNGAVPSVSNLLQKREVGLCGPCSFTLGDCCFLTSCFLPNKMKEVARYRHKAFCGTYSKDGSIFLSACQDRQIRVYDSALGKFNLMKTIQAKDVGWSILDTAFSPDGNFLIYSSWSDCIHICSIHGDYDTHNALHLFPTTDHSFCIFSVCFSEDNKEILGGANDGCLYVYDRERGERTLKIECHEDDVNAVAFADASSHIVFSGGDDGLCKVWDRRMLRENNNAPVGVLAGHSDGITYIDSKGDTRYLVSNCKDQTIKLWDMRKFSSQAAQDGTRREVARQTWDYRWQQVPRKVVRKTVTIPGDSSLMTYKGHSVLNTLIRARFSPLFSTGQRYIYSGCASGAVIIYDVLTGRIVKKLEGHRACVRDVSWHPYENQLLSTSWDSTVGLWSCQPRPLTDTEGESDMDLDDDDSDVDADGESCPRRSRRLKIRRQRLGRREGQQRARQTAR